MKFLLLLCAILFQSQAEAAEEVELKACIKGHDVYLIMDVHVPAQSKDKENAKKHVYAFLNDLSNLIDDDDTQFSILGFPRSNSGSLKWREASQLDGAKNHVSRCFDDPSARPDMNEALEEVNRTISNYHTLRADAPDSLIVLTHNRPKRSAASEELDEDEGEDEGEDEDKGLNSPAKDGKVRMADLAGDIQALAMVYVVAIGQFGEYELTDVASCGSSKCLEKLNSFNGLEGLTKRFLTKEC